MLVLSTPTIIVINIIQDVSDAEEIQCTDTTKSTSIRRRDRKGDALGN